MQSKEWIADGEKRFGIDKKKWKFVCPNCGNIQCCEDFIKLGVNEPQNYVFFSCIGRFIPESKGTIFTKGKKPCTYTNGGLFDLSKLKITDDDGKEHSVFEFAQ